MPENGPISRTDTPVRRTYVADGQECPSYNAASAQVANSCLKEAATATQTLLPPKAIFA